MSAADFVRQQLLEQFEGVSRLNAELARLRERVVRTEITIEALEWDRVLKRFADLERRLEAIETTTNITTENSDNLDEERA